MKKSQLKQIIREVVQTTKQIKPLTEGMFSGIDLIAKQSKTKEQFISKLKAFVKRNAADPSVAEDKEFLQQMSDLYFTVSGEKVTESIVKLKRFIRESVLKVSKTITENTGAFRRLVIDTNKLDLVSKEIADFIKKPNIKSDYPDMKITVKPGVKPNVLVVDVEATSGTALANKISDIAKKFDKSAKIKVRKELKLKPKK
jgi:hypothetical protein